VWKGERGGEKKLRSKKEKILNLYYCGLPNKKSKGKGELEERGVEEFLDNTRTKKIVEEGRETEKKISLLGRITVWIIRQNSGGVLGRKEKLKAGFVRNWRREIESQRERKTRFEPKASGTGTVIFCSVQRKRFCLGTRKCLRREGKGPEVTADKFGVVVIN